MASLALPLIGSLIGGLFGGNSSKRAGDAIANANIAAEHGVQNAASQGQAGIDTTVGNANTSGNAARTGAVNDVNTATGLANNTLQAGFNGQAGNLQPYLQGGQQGIQQLADYAASKPTFNFAPTQAELENTPGYKFQLGQGTQAVNNSASSSGLLASGNTLEALQNYGQGLAGTYYQNAFKNAQDTFNTNQNATLNNLSTLAGAGLNASNQFNQASQNNYNQQAHNTLGAGLYSGNTAIDLNKFLSGLNMNGSQFNANLGLTGAVDAGNFANAAAQGTAAGIQGQSNAWLGGLKGLTNGLNFGGGGGGGNAPFYNPEPGVWE